MGICDYNERKEENPQWCETHGTRAVTQEPSASSIKLTWAPGAQVEQEASDSAYNNNKVPQIPMSDGMNHRRRRRIFQPSRAVPVEPKSVGGSIENAELWKYAQK